MSMGEKGTFPKPKWAPDNAEGLHAYVVTTSEWGRSYDRIEYASSLAEAKAHFGWTRARFVYKKVRRAKAEDVGGEVTDA